MSGEPLRIGLVGYGLAGKVFHTPLYKAAERIATCYQNRRYDADFLTLRQLIDVGQSRIPTFKGDWPALYRELSVAIRQGRRPPVTSHQARNTIAVIEAVVESSRAGKRITFP